MNNHSIFKYVFAALSILVVCLVGLGILIVLYRSTGISTPAILLLTLMILFGIHGMIAIFVYQDAKRREKAYNALRMAMTL